MYRYIWEGLSSDILQYNITSDTIATVSSLSSPSSGGLALRCKDTQFIYYFGGDQSEQAIHRFNPATKYTEKLSTTFLPSKVLYAAGVTINNTAYIFNGPQGDILEFDCKSETVKIIGNLSFGPDSVHSSVNITDTASNWVWLFPGFLDKSDNHVLMFNTESKITSLPGYNVSFPTFISEPMTVWTGLYGYIIGGIANPTKQIHEDDDHNRTTAPSSGILR
jgi:hypothetical protein